MLITSPNILYERWWQVSERVEWSILVPKYFSLQDCFSIKSSSISQVDNLLIYGHKRAICKLSQPCSFCCYFCSVLSRMFLLALSLLTLTLAITHKKRHKFFTSLLALICRLIFLSGVKLQKVQRILALAYFI